MNYGFIIKSLRERYGYTQEDIATMLGINRSTYKQYELQYDIIPLKHLDKLSLFYNVRMDYLLGFASEKEKCFKSINITISAKRIKNLRKTNKITQDKLSSIIKIDQGLLSKYESGKYLISTPTLIEYVNYFNVSADYLLGKIDKKVELKPLVNI